MPICYGNSGGYGRFIERVSQPIAVDERPKPKGKQIRKSDSKPVIRNRGVRQVETGVEFKSANAAAMAILVGTTYDPLTAAKQIRKCCRGERMTWHGCRWEYVDEEADADAVPQGD